MPENHTYAVTELVGTSTDGVDDAIQNAITQASLTLRHLDWFEVTNVRDFALVGAPFLDGQALEAALLWPYPLQRARAT